MWCEKFKGLLERVRVGQTTVDDVENVMKLHHVFYKADKEFKDKIENHKRTMWLFSNNNEVRKKNMDKLVETSKTNKLPVARLNCWYNTNKKQRRKERCSYTSHFDSKCYKSQTELCIGA